MERQVRIALWCLGGAVCVVALACLLVVLFADSTREMVSYCSRCHVVQYRRYYVIHAFGSTWKLPGGLDVTGRIANNDCPHQIVRVGGSGY